MPAAESLSGQMVGAYHVVEEVGRGGMAVVYRAREIGLRRDVALKVLPPHFAGDAAHVLRFIQEARAAARLTHPGIVKVYTAGEQDGRQYIAMEYIDGKTLADIVRQQGCLSVGQAVMIALDVLAALAEAHRQGVIHRDVKPQNIMVLPDGRVKVTDFGLAKILEGFANLTVPGTRMGTPAYMPPEQCLGKPADTRSDIYSLGMTLYVMLAGRLPFEAGTPLVLMYQVVSAELTPLSKIRPGIPPEVEGVVRRMTAKRPEDRFQSAEDAAKALKSAWDSAIGKERRFEARSTTIFRCMRDRIWDRRKNTRFVVGAAILATVAVAAVLVGLFGRSEQYPADSAEPANAQASPAEESPTETPFPSRGEQTILADSIKDFSGIQGKDNWRYGYYEQPGDSSSFREAPVFDEKNQWAGPEGRLFVTIWDTGAHPSPSSPVVRRWTSDLSGTVSIYGDLAKLDGGTSGDGVTGRLLVDGTEVWSQHIVRDDTKGVFYAVDALVSIGSNVDFTIEPGENNWQDSTKFTAIISTGTPRESQEGTPSLPGAQQIIADSVRDFSGTQGKNNWYYGLYERPMEPSSFRQISQYSSTPDVDPNEKGLGPMWKEPGLVAKLWANGASPITSPSVVRRWRSAVNGKVTIYGDFFKGNVGDTGDGVTAYVLVDGTELWAQHIASNDAKGVFYTVDADVDEGSFVDFVMIPGNDPWGDESKFTATIVVVAEDGVSESSPPEAPNNGE